MEKKKIIQIVIWIVLMVALFFLFYNSASFIWDGQEIATGKPAGGIHYYTPWNLLISSWLIISAVYWVIIYFYNKKKK